MNVHSSWREYPADAIRYWKQLLRYCQGAMKDVPGDGTCTNTTLPADPHCRLDDLATKFASCKPHGWRLGEKD